MRVKKSYLHNDTTSRRNSWQVCSDILFQNFFFISDFFHNYIYLMFLFSFGVWTVWKGNNIISEKMKYRKHFWTLKIIKTAVKFQIILLKKHVCREEVCSSAELTGHHLSLKKYKWTFWEVILLTLKWTSINW